MRLKSNGGSMILSHKASMKGHDNDVCFSKDAITNVITLRNLIKQHRVAHDSKDQMFVVHRETQNKPNMEFKMHENGLHCFDPRDKDFVFLNAVSGNKEGFTQQQIKDAEIAKALHAKLGHPSMKDHKWVIQSNQTQDCPETAKDVDVAHQIWGKNIAVLKGKTARKKAVHVAGDFVKIPKELLKLHLETFLAADAFFVNKIPFFLTLSHKMHFTVVNHLANKKVETIFKAFEETCKFHLHRGFKITTVHADGEFAPLQALTQAMPGGPRVNLARSSKHVPEIERRIRVAKERHRSTRHSLPFNKIPKPLVICVIFLSVKLLSVKLLNHFPAKGGVSDTVSPKTIMTGKTLHCKKHLSLQLGQHCQVHEQDTPRNSPLPRTKGAICLGPSANLQGGHRFMSLHSMKKIVRHSWDAIPMPNTVIARVNKLAKDEPEQFVFADRSSRLIGHVELPGVDGDENETPQDLEIDHASVVEEIHLKVAPNEETEEATPQPELDAIEPFIKPRIKVETMNEVEQVNKEPVQAPDSRACCKRRFEDWSAA
jgi:hypothetical protein